MSTTAQKLRLIREDRLGWSMAKMAKLLGFSHASGYQRYELEESYRRHKFIKADIVHKLIKGLVGQGRPPITEEEVLALGGVMRHGARTAQIAPSGSVHVPEIDIDSTLGIDWLLGDVELSVPADAVKELWAIPASYLQELNVGEHGLCILRVTDDGMTGLPGKNMLAGDVVLVDRKNRQPRSSGVYALNDGFNIIVRRLAYVANSNPPTISVRPSNPAHESYERTEAEMQIIGRCIWHAHRLK